MCLCRTQPAPPVYKDLGGAYGLCKHDPAWAVLDTAEPPALGTRCVLTSRDDSLVGRLQPDATRLQPSACRLQAYASRLPPHASRFVTSAMLEASASPACLSAEGFCTPVNVGNGSIEYQPQPTAVVRFCSGATDRSGFHTLLPTALTEDEMEYDLPPLSTITLQQVHEPGSWHAYDGVTTVDQRLLTVSVGFAFP